MNLAFEPKTKTLRGRLLRSRFHDQNNGFCILNVEMAETPEYKSAIEFGGATITCKGYLPAIRQGEEYEFVGQWVNDPKWGWQFQFSKAEAVLPSTTDGAVRYLSSLAYGVGLSTAKKIVDTLGKEAALQNIINDPDKLYKLPFLKRAQAEEMIESLMQNTILAELASMICRDGIGPSTAARIYAKYGSAAVEKVKENPYIITEDVFGIGFKKADIIANGLGVAPDSPYRIEAAYTYMLREATNEGHVFLRPNDTIPRLKDLLGKDIVDNGKIQLIAEACRALQEKGKVTREIYYDDCDDKDRSAIYDKALYAAEMELTGRIRKLIAEEALPWPGIEERIMAQENDIKIEYAAQQKEAVAVALQNPMSVVTGGPGTGKSTVTKAICNIYAETHSYRPIYLASPTGKAAKRLEEATGREAKTIHRLLCYNPNLGFEHNENNPLPGPGLLILDEVSMMDVELAASLFKAIDAGMTVVLVGDEDQLPSVGPGKVLADIISSGVVPVVRLQFNYRQAGGSKIAEYAHWIVTGRVPPLVHKDGDYECRVCEDADAVRVEVESTIKEALSQGMSAMEFQVLAPMRRNSIGVEALNEMVRELVNPPGEDKPEYKYGKDKTYRIMDKVMVIKNDYNLGVFNGDMGVVKEIQSNGIVVDIDGWEYTFGHNNLDKLTHAYAITIHKSQGSEFKLAIVVCHTQSYIMLQRNLIYTGITRAKNRLVLLTNERGIKRAVENDKQAERLSLLKMRLRGQG